MFTGRMRIRVPGIFAPSESDTPSLGCTVRTSWFGRTPTGPSLLEAEVRDRLERDRDLGDLARQALARAQVERHARPAPVVDLEAQRRVRLGVGVGRDALLLEVARHVLAADGARACTGRGRRSRSTSSAVGGVIARRTLTFSSRTSSAVKFTGGSMHEQAQQLEHVVLHEVAQRAGAVVVARAAADADVLGRGDLDVVDVVAVPERLEEPVGEAERQDVLDRLLAEVVVDAEDLAARRRPLRTRRLSSRASASVVPNGFSMTTRTSASSRWSSPRCAERLDDHREELGRGGQVEGAVQRVADLARRTRRGSRRAARRPSGRRRSRGRSARRRAAGRAPARRASRRENCGSRRRPSRGTPRRTCSLRDVPMRLNRSGSAPSWARL